MLESEYSILNQILLGLSVPTAVKVKVQVNQVAYLNDVDAPLYSLFIQSFGLVAALPFTYSDFAFTFIAGLVAVTAYILKITLSPAFSCSPKSILNDKYCLPSTETTLTAYSLPLVGALMPSSTYLTRDISPL